MNRTWPPIMARGACWDAPSAGEDSWKVDPTFLTSRQAMADYANLLVALKKSWGAEDRWGGGPGAGRRSD